MHIDSPVLIVFASKYGQTGKIARRIASVIGESDVMVELWQAGRGKPSRPLQSYSGIVVGGAVFFGRHLGSIRKFIARNVDVLTSAQTAFFSVSGAAGGTTDEDRKVAQEQIDALLKSSGWSPGLQTGFGGAIQPSKYNWFIRFIVRRVAESKGEKLEATDVEFTDWKAVDDFARQFVKLLQLQPAA